MVESSTWINVIPGAIRYLRSDDADSAVVEGVPTNPQPSGFIETSQTALIDQVNARLAHHIRAYFVGVGAVILASLLFLGVLGLPFPRSFNRLPLVLTSIPLLIGVFINCRRTGQLDTIARTTTFEYRIHPSLVSSFDTLKVAADQIAQARAIWHVPWQVPVANRKWHAGAGSNIARRPAQFVIRNPPLLRTNVSTPTIILGDWRLVFLTDAILIGKSGAYHSISYSQLQVNTEGIRFIEHEMIPNDSMVIDYTWQFVNRDGGPDLRFAHNRRLPVVYYQHLAFTAPPDLDFHVYISNAQTAQHFAESLRRYIHAVSAPLRHQPESGGVGSQQRQPPSGSRGNPGAQHGPPSGQERGGGQDRGPAPFSPLAADPYTLLSVPPTASRAEVEAAFRRMAQLNHPDKVAHLDPEFRKLAEERMTAINEAYAQLKRKFDGHR